MTRSERAEAQLAWHEAEFERIKKEVASMRGGRSLSPLKRLMRQRAAEHGKTSRLLRELLRANKV